MRAASAAARASCQVCSESLRFPRRARARENKAKRTASNSCHPLELVRDSRSFHRSRAA